MSICVPRYESEVTKGLCPELEISQLVKHVPKFESERICVHSVRSLKSVKFAL